MDSYAALRSSLDDLFGDVDIRILHDGTESSVRVLEINHWDDAPVFFMFDPDVDSKLYDGENNSVFSLTPHQTGLWDDIYCLDVWASEFIVDLDYDVLCDCSDHATNLNIGFDIASLRVSSVKDVSPDVAWALGILVCSSLSLAKDHPVSASLRDIVKHENHDCYV
jgi:hypothetical protein